MTVRFADQTTTRISGVDVPLPGVTIYVYSTDTGQLATLTADGGGSLSNPFTSDALGNYAINVAAAGLYDLAFYVGGKQIFRENGVYIGTGDRLTTIVQGIVGGMSLTVTSATGQTVSTRGLLAGISSPVSGQVAYLTEAGREGAFKFDSSNLSASVTADTYQGIYVAPAAAPTGASGAWVRVTGISMVWRLAWFGGTTAVADISPIWTSAIGLLPVGGILDLDAGTYTQTTSAGRTRSDYKVQGRGMGSTKFVMAVGSGAIGNLGIVGSNVQVDGIWFVSNSDHLGSGNNPNVGVGNPNGVGAVTYENVRITNCRFSGAAIGVIFSGSDDNNATMALLLKPYVLGCVFEVDTQGVSIVGCKDAYVGPCLMRMTASAPNNVSCAVRIWGSDDTTVEGLRGNVTGDNGIYISTMNRTTPGTGIRRANTNVTIRDCKLTSVGTAGILAVECRGDLVVDGCFFQGDPFAGTNVIYGLQFTGGFAAIAGLVPVIDRVTVRDSIFHGFSVPIREQMAMRSLSIWNCRFVGNSNATAYPGGKVCGNFDGGCVQFEVDGGSSFMMLSQAAGANFRIGTGSATTRVRIANTVLPEGPTTIVSDAAAAGVIIDTAAGVTNYSAGWFAQLIA